jgi:N,N'-diacetylbacillosaminyl-diphospho-undecaprenol alpha-1,3-N-acetylgalactosaminyltransferase
MRILHTHKSFRMAQRFVVPLIYEDRRRKDASELITIDKASTKVGTALFVNRFFNYLGFIWGLIKIIFVFKPDVIVAHNSRSSILPLLIARLAGIKVRIYFNHGVPHIAYRGISRHTLKFLEFLSCKNATHVLTVSKHMQQILHQIRSSNETLIILNGSACGVEYPSYESIQDKRKKFRNDYRYTELDILYLYIGRPVKRKGFYDVLDLWLSYLRRSGGSLILLGIEEADVLKRLGYIPERIYCLGVVENPSEALSAADFLLLPSHHEGLSYSVLEAMAYGAVVIANDIPGVRCIVEHGQTGFLVKDNSIAAYAAIIDKISNRHFDLDSIRKNAYLAVQKYSRKDFLQEYSRFMVDLVSER